MTNRSRLRSVSLVSLVAWTLALACGESNTGTPTGTGGTAAGGLGAGGGGTPSGGTTPGGGASATGGSSLGGGAIAGGTSNGGGTATGGAGGGVASGGGDVGAGGGPAAGGSGSGGGGPEPTVLTVQLDQVRQIIRGFGLNGALVKDKKALPWSQLYKMDDPDKGLGLSILRIGMAPDGTHRDVSSGWETVKDMGARVIGSCWSAPAEWKTNNKLTNGGHLKPENYTQWAQRIAKYAKDNGLYAMSIGNETDFASCAGSSCQAPLTDEYDSMVYTGEELANFAAKAGPIFKSDAPGVKMIAPEASLWIHVWSNLSPTNKANGGYDSSDPLDCACFSNAITDAAAAGCASHCKPAAAGELSSGGYDYGHWLAKVPGAWDAFEIMGTHEYESQIAYAWPADVNDGVRDKEVWQTEMSGVMYWPEQGPSTDIANGVAVARWIHSALTIGEASAWLYWWYEAYYQNDNEGLALTKGGSTIAKRYYTMGNFSRYIRPDMFHAVKVGGPAPDKVLVSAYKADDGKLVIVAINETNAAVNAPIAISGGTAPAMMIPYVTDANANWKAGTAVAGGSLTAALPAMSVTTFVSQ